MTVKSSIPLTHEQAAFARALVAEGRNVSVSAVVRLGLDLLRSRTEGQMVEREALRQLLAERRQGTLVAFDAIDRAERRAMSMRGDIDALTERPCRGTRHDDLMRGLRHVAMGRAVVRFEIVEADAVVRVLAVFVGGQDRTRVMLARLPER